MVAAALGGAYLGFLPFNVAPGRLILGDTGSLSAGALIAWLGLQIDWGLAAEMAGPAPLAVFGVVAFEVVWVSAWRASIGLPPWRASPHHFVYWLVERGLSAPAAVLTLGAAQVALAALPLSATLGPWGLAIPALTLGLLGVGALRVAARAPRGTSVEGRATP